MECLTDWLAGLKNWLVEWLITVKMERVLVSSEVRWADDMLASSHRYRLPQSSLSRADNACNNNQPPKNLLNDAQHSSSINKIKLITFLKYLKGAVSIKLRWVLLYIPYQLIALFKSCGQYVISVLNVSG